MIVSEITIEWSVCTSGRVCNVILVSSDNKSLNNYSKYVQINVMVWCSAFV